MPANNLAVKMQLRIAKSPQTVFEAIADPRKMSRYFISSGSARLDAGKPVVWNFADVGVKLTVKPKKIQASRIAFLWAASGVETLVVIALARLGKNATRVKVSESGWAPDGKGIARCVGQTRGWTHMLCCMKAYLEHDINLRKGGAIK